MASEVIVVTFGDTYGAQGAMSAVRALTELDHAWLDDVAIVERHNSGRISTHTTYGSVAAGAAWGGITGMLVGLLFPPLGFVALWAGGMAVGAGVEKATKEHGLPKELLEQIKGELAKGTSALILIGAGGDVDEMSRAFERYQPTNVIRESIADATVESMQRSLSDAEKTADAS